MSRIETALEAVALLRQTGRWWILPPLAVLLASGVLLVAVQAIEYVAPFVYTIF